MIALLLIILIAVLSCNTIVLSGLEDKCKDGFLPLHKIVSYYFWCVWEWGRFCILLYFPSPVAVTVHLHMAIFVYFQFIVAWKLDI